MALASGRTRLRPEAFTVVTDDATERAPGKLGELFETVDGKTYRLVQNHDPNTVSMAQNDPVGYEADDTTGYKVTPDLSESASGIFAGASAASTAPTDDDYFFIQVGGFGSVNLTGSANVAPGETYEWTADNGISLQASATNNGIFRAAVTATSVTVAQGFIEGRVR